MEDVKLLKTIDMNYLKTMSQEDVWVVRFNAHIFYDIENANAIKLTVKGLFGKPISAKSTEKLANESAEEFGKDIVIIHQVQDGSIVIFNRYSDKPGNLKGIPEFCKNVLDNIKIKTGISNLGQDRICISNNPWWDIKNRPLGFLQLMIYSNISNHDAAFYHALLIILNCPMAEKGRRTNLVNKQSN